jgi:WD40 repeat protein
LGGGIGRIEMLNTTNILALVGGGKNPKFSINKIIIWDDKQTQNNIIGELRFNTPVLNVKIKMDRLIGICQSKIYIFNLNTLETIDMFDTFDNINGIVGFSPGELISVLAFPYDSKGKVRIVNFNSLAQPPIITAHESKIACLCVNRNGTLLATASDKGTLIRIFDVKD